MSIAYNKLVRDRIPEIIESSGRGYRVRTATPEEFEEYVIKKLQEELDEFKESKELKELADLLEVVYAVAALHGWTRDTIENLRKERTKSRGAFKKRLILMETD
jgi:predicted house-cleaning noncanonical NTP pyrophosphatase (MazG superfamily)